LPNGALVADVMESGGTPINKYHGVWNHEREYNAGDFVTHEGSMFCAKSSTRSKPGASDDWQLAVKRGRDGKSAR
jgi:hypothetical protein